VRLLAVLSSSAATQPLHGLRGRRARHRRDAVIVGVNLAGGSKPKATKGGAVVGTFPLTTAVVDQVANVPAKTIILAAEKERRIRLLQTSCLLRTRY